MKEKDGHSLRLEMREWCMLEPALPEKPAPYQGCLCLHCPISLKNSKVLGQVYCILQSTTGWGNFPPTVHNFHRLLLDLSAIHQWPVGTEFCRSAETSCRRQFWQQQRIDSIWHGISGTCEHNHTPYHVYGSKEHGTWFSDHQSRISMRDGPKNQSVQFQCGMICT